MRRSGGVTAAVVVLFACSALVLLFAVLVPIAVFEAPLPQPVPPFMHGMMIGMGVIYFLCAAWGIITGIGILRLRDWARVSMLVLSATVAVFCVFGSIGAIAGPLMVRDPQVPRGATVAGLIVGLVVVTIPLALAIWWLVLFTRSSVRLQFALGVTFEPAHPPVFARPVAYAEGAATCVSPRMQLAYRRPVSITVIAVCLLAGCAFFPLMFFYPPNWRITAIFGVIVTGRSFLLVWVVLLAASLSLGIGLLRLKAWARRGSIAYFVVMLVNTALSVRVIGRVMEMMQKQMDIPAPQLPAAFMKTIAAVGFIFGVCLYVAAIYFLVTRHAAFDGPPPDASASANTASSFRCESSGAARRVGRAVALVSRLLMRENFFRFAEATRVTQF